VVSDAKNVCGKPLLREKQAETVPFFCVPKTFTSSILAPGNRPVNHGDVLAFYAKNININVKNAQVIVNFKDDDVRR